MIHTRWGREAPECTKAKRHRWNAGETGVCSLCGWDVFDQQYKRV